MWKQVNDFSPEEVVDVHTSIVAITVREEGEVEGGEKRLVEF